MLFADAISLFSLVQKIDTSATHLNNDLKIKISNWAFMWKIRFNPDPSKQAHNPDPSKQAQIKLNFLEHIKTLSQ